MEWYRQSINNTIEKLSSNLDTGLSNNEAEERLKKYGLNELEEKGKSSIWSKMLLNLKIFRF